MKRISVASLFRSLAFGVLLLSANGISVFAEDLKPTLTLTDYSLFVDGVPQAERVGTMDGRVFWFSLPKQGQFIISPEPHEGYKFEKIARVSGNTISFSLEGKLYQWVSTAPILSDGGEMEMWVLHDAEFQPKKCGKSFCAGSSSSFEYFLEHRKRDESR